MPHPRRPLPLRRTTTPFGTRGSQVQILPLRPILSWFEIALSDGFPDRYFGERILWFAPHTLFLFEVATRIGVISAEADQASLSIRKVSFSLATMPATVAIYWKRRGVKRAPLQEHRRYSHGVLNALHYGELGAGVELQEGGQVFDRERGLG